MIEETTITSEKEESPSKDLELEQIDRESNTLSPELYFLVANALSVGPLAHLGDLIAREAVRHDLFPARTDFLGRRHPLSLPELRRRYRHAGPDALANVAASLLEHIQRLDEGKSSWKKPSSLLDPAVLEGKELEDAAMLRWTLPPLGGKNGGRGLSMPRLSFLRECGVVPLEGIGAKGALSRAGLAERTEHHWTVRGHSQSTYCVAIDPSGRYIITGSDDRLVKVWSAATAMLICSCRGHELEISDLAVAPDSSCFASCSTDSNIRVWSLISKREDPSHSGQYSDAEKRERDPNNGRLGIGVPLAVLRGHVGIVTFMDFSPVHPHILVSSGFDGVCRMWNVLEPSVPPIVLRPVEGVSRQIFSGIPDTRVTRRTERRRGLRSLYGSERFEGDSVSRMSEGDADSRDESQGAPSRGRQHVGNHDEEVHQQGRSRRVGHRESNNSSLTTQANRDEDNDDQMDLEHVPTDGAQGEPQDFHHALLTCGFSRDGQFVMAGSADNNAYVWRISFPELKSIEGETHVHNYPRPDFDRSAEPESPKDAPVIKDHVDSAVGTGHSKLQAALPVYSFWKSSSGEAMEVDDAKPSTTQLESKPTGKRDEGGNLHERRSTRETWPLRVEEMVRLDGHQSDVYLLQQSHSGRLLATGSKDGNICLWKCPRRLRRAGRRPNWTLVATLTCPIDEAALALARQRRRALPPPRVDQIAFTADDAHLVASFQDFAVHVFEVRTGKHIHSLSGVHTEQIHVLLNHPIDPAIAISAGYGGEVVMWDVIEGSVLKTFDSRDTRPDGRRWPDEDRLPFTDGYISSSGEYFALTDAAGQLHVFGLGTRSAFTKRAPYDQFLSTDYDALMWDAAGNAASIETQLPAHILSGREALCDISLDPYPLPFQHAFKEKRLLSATPSEASWLQPGKHPGYLLAPPTLTSAAWRVYLTGGGDTSVQNAIARASRRLEEHEQRLDRLEMETARRAERPGRISGTDANAGRNANAVGSAAAPEHEETINLLEEEDRGETGRRRARSHSDQERIDRRRDRIYFSENAIADYADEDELAALLDDDDGPRSVRGGEARRDAEAHPATRHSERLARASAGLEEGLGSRDHPSTGYQHGQYAYLGGEDEDGVREMQRRQREERARRRQGSHDEASHRSRRSRRAAARRSRFGGGDDDERLESYDDEEGNVHRSHQAEERPQDIEDEEFVPSDLAGEEDDYLSGQDEDENPSEVNYLRASLEEYDVEDEEEEEEEELVREMQETLSDEDGLEPHRTSRRERRHGVGSSRAVRSIEQREHVSRRRRRREEARAEETTRSKRRRKSKKSKRDRDAELAGVGESSSAQPRAFSSYSWLISPSNPVAEYIPQKGDEVVYLREGHASALASLGDTRPPPWQSLSRGRSLRPAEPCVVDKVEYHIASDETESTFARLNLRLSDLDSPLYGRVFSVDIPSPSMGHAEFVVLRDRFEASLRHVWSLGDSCYAYWQTGEPGPDGSPAAEWWMGVIEGDRCLEGADNRLTNDQILSDPYSYHCVWERYRIRWKGIVKRQENGSVDAAADGPSYPRAQLPSGNTPSVENIELIDDVDISLHSPWELFVRPDLPSETIEEDGPTSVEAHRLSKRCIDAMSRAIEIAAAQEPWMIFQAAPEWDEAYQSPRGRCEFYNRRVPLPIGLADIAARLQMNYYRQPDALRHDLSIIESNASGFNGENSDITTDARSMVKYLQAVLDSVVDGNDWAQARGGEGAANPEAIDVQYYLNQPHTEDDSHPEGHHLSRGQRARRSATSAGMRDGRRHRSRFGTENGGDQSSSEFEQMEREDRDTDYEHEDMEEYQGDEDEEEGGKDMSRPRERGRLSTRDAMVEPSAGNDQGTGENTPARSHLRISLRNRSSGRRRDYRALQHGQLRVVQAAASTDMGHGGYQQNDDARATGARPRELFAGEEEQARDMGTSSNAGQNLRTRIKLRMPA